MPAGALFHTVYGLDGRDQVTEAAHLRLGYKRDGKGAHWMAVRDGRGPVMVAMFFNSGIGDVWAYAGAPRYPGRFSGLAIHYGVNGVVYVMTH